MAIHFQCCWVGTTYLTISAEESQHTHGNSLVPRPVQKIGETGLGMRLVLCPAGNPSGNIAHISHFLGFCTRQQGLNRASTDHIWTFWPLHGFNYHQLAPAQVLGLQWAARVIGHATIWLARSNNSVLSRKAPESSPMLPDRLSVVYPAGLKIRTRLTQKVNLQMCS